MAEAIGLVASVFTLCQVVSEGLNQVTELYRAPAEIKILQEQVQIFRDVLHTVETRTEASSQNALFRALSRARAVIEELHQVINVKLVRQGDSSGRTRRRAWLRNKRKIVRLRDDLKDAREVLLGALSAELLSSTRRVESTLTLLGQRSISNHSTALRIDQRLEIIQDLLDLQEMGHITRQIPPGTSKYSRIPYESRESPERISKSSIGTFDHLLQSSSFQETDTAIISRSLQRAYAQPRNNQLAKRAVPVSPFEMLTSFRPETYTVEDAVPVFVCDEFLEVESTEYSRINQCALMYFQAPRQWTGLTATITTSIESKYWNIQRGSTSVDIPRKNQEPLPSCLATAIELTLKSCQNLTQDSQLSIFLGSGPNSDKSKKESEFRIRVSRPSFQVKAYLQEITSMVHHWNCPKYSESGLLQRPLNKGNPTDSKFIAYLESRWVLQIWLGSSRPYIDANLYILKVLHCLQGSPGINRFVGVVLDGEGIINSFLCELPAKGRLIKVVSKAKNSGSPVSSERRGKWCKQIIQGVAQMHSKGFVVGLDGGAARGFVAIDVDDNAVLFDRFRTTYAIHKNGVNNAPPEHRQSSLNRSLITASLQTDIYHLGGMLWQIFMDLNDNTLVLPSGNCKSSTTKAEILRTEPQSDCVPRSSLDDEPIPRYLRNIISACCAESPSERPPAWKLLEMVPPIIEESTNLRKAVEDGAILSPSGQQDVSTNGGTSEDNTCPSISERYGPRAKWTAKPITRLEDCFEKYDRIFWCNICGEYTTEQFFHCNICEGGNYDLCPHCFSQGVHCLEFDHYLREYSYGNKESKYYTNMKETGHRKCITL